MDNITTEKELAKQIFTKDLIKYQLTRFENAVREDELADGTQSDIQRKAHRNYRRIKSEFLAIIEQLYTSTKI